MAKNDIEIVDSAGLSRLPVKTLKVDDYTTSGGTQILAGEPVKISGAEGGNYAIQLADGEPAIGTDIVLGIAASNDSATSTVDGTVDVYMPVPGAVYRAKATTPGNLADGILLDTVTFDLAAGVFTVDENEGTDEDVHGLRIIDFDTRTGTVDFEFKINATRYGDLVA